MSFELEPLPFLNDALEPYVSSKTIDFHHKKHHKTYVDNLNKFISGTKFENMSLVDIIKISEKEKNLPIFNNAAQTWNHNFYWKSIKKDSVPDEKVLQKIALDFASLAEFKEKFAAAALSQFGSGWAWLVLDKVDNKLKIIKTGNAETPIVNDSIVALSVIDVWEHAYYLDYQNKRAEYVNNFLEHLINWDYISHNL